MQIVFSRHAKKMLKTLDVVVSTKIIEKIRLYAKNPSALANQVKRLKGDPLLRLRAGDYRVLFEEDGTVLMIVRVDHRKDVYR